MIRSTFSRLTVGGWVILLFGCAEPPNLDPVADQVPNVNETLTQSKDASWDLYEWPTVDEFIINGSTSVPALVPSNGDGGCAIGLAEQGEIIYLGVYGDARPGQAWDYGTVAPVGSIAKTFTALAAMSLTQIDDPTGNSLLMLSDRVGEVLGTNNNDLATVRVDDMLTHLSGVGGDQINEAGAPNWVTYLQTPDCTLMDATACPEISKGMAEPRIAFNLYESAEVVEDVSNSNGMYSNVGYSVLGAIIDEITHGETALDAEQRGYEKFTWDRLANWTGVFDGRRMLTPALTHSWRVADGDFLRYARGYPLDVWEGLASDDPGLGFIAAIEGWEGPSGGWALSIGDLTRFATLFGNDDFIPADVRDAMVQPVSQPLGSTARWYGYGVFGNVDPDGDLVGPSTIAYESFKRWYHGGDIGSHAAYWAHWPEASGGPFSAAIICNNMTANSGSLATLEPAIGWLFLNALRIEDDRPVLKTVIGQLPSAAQVRRASYHMDFSSARFVSPPNLFLPLGAIKPMAIQFNGPRERGQMRMTLKQRKGRKAVAFNARIDRKNQRLQSSPFDMALKSPRVKLTLHDVSLQFGFSPDRQSLVGLSLNGTLDTRSLLRGNFIGDWREACATAQHLGTACQRCDDGLQTCLEVEIADIQAYRMR